MTNLKTNSLELQRQTVTRLMLQSIVLLHDRSSETHKNIQIQKINVKSTVFGINVMNNDPHKAESNFSNQQYKENRVKTDTHKMIKSNAKFKVFRVTEADW